MRYFVFGFNGREAGAAEESCGVKLFGDGFLTIVRDDCFCWRGRWTIVGPAMRFGKTVTRFVMGDQGPAKGLSGGLISIIRPTKCALSALEMPLMFWARQAEITADRAGLLAVGDEEVARRVLLSWSLRSVSL